MKKIGQEESRIANNRKEPDGVVVGADKGVTLSQEELRIGEEGVTETTMTSLEKSHQDRWNELEDLERDLKKRRADRIAEEEQLERLLLNAKLEAEAREKEDAERNLGGMSNIRL